MTTFKITNHKTDKIKWFVYILSGLGGLIYLFNYSEIHFITKFLISIPVIINLFFDISYYKKEGVIITQLNFNVNNIEIINNKNKTQIVNYSDLKYSIRKRKFDKHKTEIELKVKNNFLFKTVGRVHISNWPDIFDIEKQFENNKVERTEWKPKTLWGKYWGLFIDLFFLTTQGHEYDGDFYDYQEDSIKEVTENPIKEDKK